MEGNEERGTVIDRDRLIRTYLNAKRTNYYRMCNLMIKEMIKEEVVYRRVILKVAVDY